MKRALQSNRFAWLIAVAVALTIVNMAEYFWSRKEKEGATNDLLPAFVGLHRNGSERVGTDAPASKEVTNEMEIRLSDDSAGNPFGSLSIAQEPVVHVADVPPKAGPRTLVAPVVLPSAPVPVAVSPEPVAPPLPFQFIGLIAGKELGDGKTIAFLSQAGRALTISEGDEINALYKVEAILETRIDLTYLPLKKRQSLPIARQ